MHLANNVDNTRLLLIAQYGTERLRSSAEIILKTLANYVEEPTIQRGFPLPHGSEYSTIKSLTEDVILRCQVEGVSPSTLQTLLSQVIKQHTGQEL